jgi:hypothetical protein
MFEQLLLLTSIIGMKICTFLLGLYFYIYPPSEHGKTTPEPNNLGWLPVTSMGLFLMFFALGYGSVVRFLICNFKNN